MYQAPFEASDSLFETAFLGLVEAAVNKALVLDPQALAEVKGFTGKVLRVKTYEPYTSVYLIFCEDGVQIYTHFDGQVDARLRLPAAKLLLSLFHKPVNLNTSDLEIRISGDRALVASLFRILADYDLLNICRRVLLEWFPDLENWPVLIEKIKGAPPEWVETVQSLPVHFQETVGSLQTLVGLQKEMLAELKQLNLSLERKNRQNKLGWGVALMGILIAVWFLVL